jgi:hypothetical protein
MLLLIVRNFQSGACIEITVKFANLSYSAGLNCVNTQVQSIQVGLANEYLISIFKYYLFAIKLTHLAICVV